jgi:glycosyltransferase involved in cell wall biosynthesis
LKTLQILPALEQGGVERGVVEVNRALAARGWENVVVSAGGRLAATIEADGGRHITMDVKSKNPLTFFQRAYRLRCIIRDERPDVVCAHSRVPAWLFAFANRALGVKWISFAHGANSISWYSRIMTVGDIVVTPSRFLADYLKGAYGLAEERIRVIPRAVEASKFDVAALDRGFIAAKRAEWRVDGRWVVMAVGRITQLKGYDTLIRALAALHSLSPVPHSPKLVIVGESEALRRNVEEDLRHLVAELDLADDVVFAGNQQKIAECLSIADVVVSANTRKPEAFGRSMAEALVMGRPVVATAFGGALDIVEDGVNGALVPIPSDKSADMAPAFADALLRVRSMRLGDLRAAALEKFSFDKMISRTVAAYEELAN